MWWLAASLLPCGSQAKHRLAATNSPHSLRPTELADGLALKSRATGEVVASRNCLVRFAPAGGHACRPLVPPFPAGAPHATDEDSAGLFEGRDYSEGTGRGRRYQPAWAGAGDGCAPAGPWGAAIIPRPRGLPPRGARSRLKTYVATPSTRERNWVLVDASGKTLGRLATQIADVLRGKRKPEYTPHIDTGDFVVVVNAEKIAVTGDKMGQKMYRRHSGYPGGLRERTLQEMLDRRPEEVIRLAVRGMLPRNRLARQQLRKLKVYAGPDHPHEAQRPQALEIGDGGSGNGSE